MFSVSNESNKIIVCVEQISSIIIDVKWIPELNVRPLCNIVSMKDKKAHIELSLSVDGPSAIFVREGYFREFTGPVVINEVVPKILSYIIVDNDLQVTYNVLDDPLIYKDADKWHIEKCKDVYSVHSSKDGFRVDEIRVIGKYAA